MAGMGHGSNADETVRCGDGLDANHQVAGVAIGKSEIELWGRFEASLVVAAQY